MRALTWQGFEDVRVEDVADPRIEQPTDAIVEITSTAICGSDLHLYRPLAMFMEPGDILGHEPMGRVVEVGRDVRHVAPGDRVVIPFNISCGSCFMCDRQLYAQCETTQVHEHGKGAALFGYTKLYGHVPGAQAELLRVPQAQFGPIKVPDGPPDDRFLFLSDVLPTAWQAVAFADVAPGGSLAVLGLGPIGQMVVRAARQRGVQRVFGVDLVPERLAMAERHGAETVDTASTDDPAEALRDLTKGRGPDAVVDAVGMEAHGAPLAAAMQRAAAALPKAMSEPLARRAGMDRLAALRTAVDTVRRGGTVSIVGVYGGAADPLPMLDLFDKGVQIRMGQAHVKRWVPEILPLLERDDDVFGLDDFVTHRLPLDDAPQAYARFQAKQDGTIKVVLQP
ncbi:MAG TPA: zinc-dependent alcohol dehydrogenase [Acidimicrobiales bacterium]|jgi:threonine dehydrogenase-like Zn-dependent dehydrogenase|nr:zinc-dependent alcohol dehydrogenase [Acidimicrobiales bacterium]